MAQSIMEVRQNNVAMSDSFELVEENFRGSYLYEPAKLMIMLAYEKPLYSTQTHQDREITEFGNLWMRKCMKNPPKLS